MKMIWHTGRQHSSGAVRKARQKKQWQKSKTDFVLNGFALKAARILYKHNWSYSFFWLVFYVFFRIVKGEHRIRVAFLFLYCMNNACVGFIYVQKKWMYTGAVRPRWWWWWHTISFLTMLFYIYMYEYENSDWRTFSLWITGCIIT